MSKALDRFLKYVSFDTQSDETSSSRPSTSKQLKLASFLAEELKETGLQNIRLTDGGYVYAELPATRGLEHLPGLGFIAHLDTSDAASGKDVKPQIIEKWNGNPIPLGNSALSLSPLPDLTGHTLVTTDGTTLLGADDKAGIAAIMTAMENIIASAAPHGKLCIGFTPDEEIGAGADFFDVADFGAKYAYTVDAGAENLIECENFNAASAVITFKGLSVHPGGAKGIMVNAQKLAMEFDALLPSEEVPSKTKGREGFYHLTRSSGNVSTAELHYIIRDHDADLFEKRKQKVLEITEQINQIHGRGSAVCVLRDQYRNMSEVLDSYPFLLEIAEDAIKSTGLEPDRSPIRGGTDGARLSFMGLPCPNIGHGGYKAHSELEYLDVQGLENSVRIIQRIVRNFCKIY